MAYKKYSTYTLKQKLLMKKENFMNKRVNYLNIKKLKKKIKIENNFFFFFF
ncbi:hypothetical protein PFTANZ_02317, partial [Plasmodium falciparum Tanzania (2000708)]